MGGAAIQTPRHCQENVLSLAHIDDLEKLEGVYSEELRSRQLTNLTIAPLSHLLAIVLALRTLCTLEPYCSYFWFR